MNSFKEPFKHLNRDPVMAYLINTFGDQISIKDRYEDDLAKAILIIKKYNNKSKSYWINREKSKGTMKQQF